MKSCFKSLIIICLALISNVGLAQDTLRLVSWNIQMLPNMAGAFSSSLRKLQRVRLPWIVDFVKNKNYDVIVFQEVFDLNIKRRLRRQLRKMYPYQVRTRTKPFKITSNGILIVSKLKMRYIDHVIYERGLTEDGMAAKGCTLVEVEKNGKKLHIGGTHLQSGGHEKYQTVRHKQYKDIFHLFRRHKKDTIPQFLIGDLNTEKHHPERYQLMLETLDLQDFPINDPRPYTADNTNSWNRDEKTPSQIDYILLNPHRTKTTIFKQHIIRPTNTHKGDTIDFADHYGIVADIILHP